MTTTAGAGAALHAGSLLAAENSPIAQLPRASFIHRKDGTALFYKDWGTGTPVVFVNSAGLNCDMWAYQMVPLTARGMRCVAFDRRGHGRSSDPGRGYDFDTLADDLAAVIDALDLRNVTLVGHSMGCSEITRYLTRHGSARIARVVMLAPVTPFLLKTADNPEGIDRSLFQALRTQWLRDYPKWIADNTPPFFVAETSPEMQRWGASMLLTTSLQAQIECNVATTETDFREELKRIKVPVLVIHGTKDVSAPFALTGQRTAKLIPGCELKVYEGAPHGLFITHMERVNEDLLRFMKA
jgi:non-heme chloroperoxidase